MMDASEVLDLSKENIQPLVHGRKADKLSTALQVNSNFQLQQELRRQREEFELQIHMYNGDDPLQLRFEYVQWLEQSYPSLGPETNIIPFLEDTLVAFKNNDQYKQDPRYVSLVIKYIQTQPNPLEIYNLVYSENIGTKLSMFYRAWAEELDTHNDIKQANHVFQLGLNAHAEPIEELEAAQMQFHMSVGRRFLTGGSAPPNEEPIPQPERQVLGKLAKKVVPGMTRLKMGAPGRMSQSDTKRPLQNSQPTGMNVYMDPNADENNYVKEPSLQNSHFKVKADVMHKENNEAPGVWTKKKTKKGATPLPAIPCTPSFPIHVDEECAQEQPAHSQISSSALKPKKPEGEHLQVFAGGETEGEGKERNMFCKNKIYLGKNELQFEEFRAARHRMNKYGTCTMASTKSNSGGWDIPVYIVEPQDNTKQPMYKKQQVYIGDNKEVQLEELRAAHYKQFRQANRVVNSGLNRVPPSIATNASNPAALWVEEIPVCVPCFNDKMKPMYPKSQIYIGGNKEVQLEELRAAQYRANKNSTRSQPSNDYVSRKLKARQSQAITPSSVKSVASFAIFNDDSVPPPSSSIKGPSFPIFDDSVQTPSQQREPKLAHQSVQKTPSAQLQPFAIYSDEPKLAHQSVQKTPSAQLQPFAIYSDEPKLAHQSVQKTPSAQLQPFAIYSDEPKLAHQSVQNTSSAQPQAFAIYSDESRPRESVPKPAHQQSARKTTTAFSVYSDDSEEIPMSSQPPQAHQQPPKTPSFHIYSDDKVNPPTQRQQQPVKSATKGPSFAIYSDEGSQDSGSSGPLPEIKSQSKVLTFSTSGEESLERKSEGDFSTSSSSSSKNSASVSMPSSKGGSAKKLGLFDTSDKDVSCNLQLQGLVADDSIKDVFISLDDMWKSPVVNKSKDGNKSAAPVP
ncbi:hypothetical protein WDU94_008607 [Cyamophila willieti]